MNYIYYILSPISALMGTIMNLIYCTISYAGIQNVGICIIFFTIFINIMMLPFTIKQQKFARISRIMSPEIQRVQKKYKGKLDQDSMMKQQQEIQEIYKKYGTNPVGSFGQIFIQMMIFMCLYKIISDIPSYVPNVKEAAFLFFGLNLMKTPGFHLTPAFIIPIMVGASQWLSTKLSMVDTPKTENEAMNATMNSMNIVMPMFSMFMCISLPAYMGIYWIAGSIARILVQMFINLYMKNYSDEDLVMESRKKKEKKKIKSLYLRSN